MGLKKERIRFEITDNEEAVLAIDDIISDLKRLKELLPYCFFEEREDGIEDLRNIKISINDLIAYHEKG